MEYLKTSVGHLSKSDKEDWEVIFQSYKEGNSFSYISDYLSINIKTLKKYLKIFFLNDLSKEECKNISNKIRERTCLEKYGESHISQIKSVIVKRNETNLKKYGSICSLHGIATKEKTRKTNLNKFGFTCNLKNEEQRNKIKQTKKEKYGDEYYNNMDKTKRTKKEKYGDEYYSNADKAKETFKINILKNKNLSNSFVGKIKNTKLNRYNNSNYNNMEKHRDTIKTKYGVDNISQINSIKKNFHKDTFNKWEDKILKPRNYTMLDKLEGVQESNGGWKIYNFKHEDCGTVFKGYFTGNMIKCPKCEVSSKKQGDYGCFIIDLGCIVRNNFRNNFGREIDIFIPELNIGFEYNGIYWHSSIHDRIHVDYHKNKTGLCFKQGIKLYHIWEYDDEEIVKSMICGILNKNIISYHARKCEIKEVNTKKRREFFNKNHLHGDVKSSFSLGLYHEEELISCISFRKHKEGIEIARFATKLNCKVRGGFSRLLKYSIEKCKQLGYSKIITYCDRDWTPDYKDSVYFKNGFKFIGDSGCILRYYDSRNNTIFNRETFQKHKLKKLFPETYSKNKTANEILKENKIFSIHNSGNWKFELDI